jgi:tripartite-type tricarboxylate transporter receptor subunit TctC
MIRLKLASIALLIAAASVAQAAEQNFPTKPIRLVVTSGAGSGVDFFARVIAPALTELYKQQVVVENRAGAGGLIGASTIAAATPDGYTIGIASTAHVVAPLLQLKPPYRPIEDFTPIALLTSIPAAVVATGAIPVKSVQELIVLAKSKPGQLNFASLGDGTAAHLQAEVFNRAAGIKVVHVPFKSVGDAHAAILSGEVQYLTFLVPSAMPLIKSSKARALAVTSKTRSVALPDVPSIVEAGLPAAETEVLIGVVAPARVPRDIAARLHRDIATVLRKPETRERFASQGGTPTPDVTAEAYGAQLRNEYSSYRKLIAELGLKPQ